MLNADLHRSKSNFSFLVRGKNANYVRPMNAVWCLMPAASALRCLMSPGLAVFASDP